MVPKLPTILIVGASGMLGSDLKTVLEKIPKWRIVSLGRDSLDITKFDEVRRIFQELKPAWVVNSAAFTDVDRAENERESAFALNVLGPRHLATCAFDIGARLVHFSTDQVFDGTGQRPWTEDDHPHPLNYYAETKYLGEKETLESSVNLLVRVQWLYGEKKDRFTPLKHRATFTPFVDQFGAPTSTRQVAEVVRELVQKEVSGLYHFAYDDFASWAEVYRFVKEELELSIRLEPKMTDDVDLPAKRPKFCVLSNQKLLNRLGWKEMGSWKIPLRQFLNRTTTIT